MKTIITLEEKNLNRLNMSKKDLFESIDTRKFMCENAERIFKPFGLETKKENDFVNYIKSGLEIREFNVDINKDKDVCEDINFYLFEITKRDKFIGSFNFSSLNSFEGYENKNEFVIWDLNKENELFIEVMFDIFITFEIFMKDIYFFATDCWQEYLEENCGFEKADLKPYKYGWYYANFYKKPWDKFVVVTDMMEGTKNA